jgi:sulfite reductase (NADPH) flavoprotein alpha-component
LSYIDLIVYNWKVVDHSLEDPMRVENLRLLIPTVDNKEEGIFYLTQVEALSQSTPLIGAIVRAQEAVSRDDIDSLKEELILIAGGLLHVTNKSFMKINPNPYSDLHVDPVVWAKTVAPFAVPINEGVAGPSGTAAPIFHILDTFFGRSSYMSRFGDEMKHLREWYPKHWQEFIEALAQISVYDYVESTDNKTLSGIFKEAIQAYIGETGFLSRHRLKVYGYLDVGFKVGRSVTITGFTGLFSDRTWDEVDEELNASRTERQTEFSQSTHFAEVKQVNTLRSEGDNWIRQIVLNTAGTGIRYRPGDRVGILPENSDEIVQKTLSALKARGNEPIRLDASWRQAIPLRDGYEDVTTVPLRTLLIFGRIRPVDRAVAKTLHAVSHNETLGRIIESRMEDQWELWDLIELLTEGGFDPKRLWKAHPGEQESITRIVPPESFRMYSVSSVMDEDGLNGASELHLTVGRLRYQTDETDVSVGSTRLGTGSNYLGDTSEVSPEDMGKVSMRVIQPPRFGLPPDETIPIVMFAGGTGFSPFRSFIQQRARQANAGEGWLYYGTRTKEDFIYQDELEQIAAQGWLNVRIAFSRDELYLRFAPAADGGRFVFEPGARQYIGDEMLRDENASALWNLLRSKEDGGLGAYFYVCGKTRFANSVMEAIKAVIYRFSEGSVEDKETAVRRILYRIVGEERYMQEIFTTYAGSHLARQAVYDASEVALHNNDEDGYWMIVDGRVHDVTEFAHLHPGGFKIVSGYSGMDGTIAYENVLHHENPEVHAMLGMYEIGKLRRLTFGMEWGSAIGPKGLQFVSLAHAYRVWVRFLYNIVEMENALHNDFTLREQTLTRGEAPSDQSPFKTQLLIDAHSRFMLNYAHGAMGQPLENIWAVTSGLCTQEEDVRWMHDTVQAIQQKEAAVAVQQLADSLIGKLEALVERNAAPADPMVAELTAYTDLLELEDLRFMSELKHALREGIKVFEEFERETIRLGSQRLLDAAKATPSVLEGYYARVYAGIQEIESSGQRIVGG